MSCLASSVCFLQSAKRISQAAIHDESQWQSPHILSINILDDDSLLNIFYLYRPPIFDGDENVDVCIEGGKRWDRELWWYKLAQVCRRWRILILGSASHLDLCLVCTYGTPVADMLSHSPSLPLVIDYYHKHWDFTAEDEEGITIALKQRHRVRRVRLWMPTLNLQKFIVAIDDEYPVLEYLIIEPPIEDTSLALILPDTLQAPHLRHLLLKGFVLPRESRLLTIALGLVMLCLHMEHPSAYFQPNTLLHWLSFMPQLEMLIIISFPIPSRDIERQLRHMPVMTHITLPNLRSFEFQGVSAYLEAVVRWIITPRLEKLSLEFFKKLAFFVPSLLQFLNTTENLRFDTVVVQFFKEKVYVGAYLRAREAEMYALVINTHCRHLDLQVSSAAQIFDSLSQIFSTVEHLTLEHEVHNLSSERHNEVDRIECCKFLRSFSNVKILRVDDGLVEELSRFLRLDDGELPLVLLPGLQKLRYSGNGDTGDAFKSFIDGRKNAGHPVALDRPSSGSVNSLSRSSSLRLSESSPVIPSEAERDLDA